jgi:hypothetical protein
VGLLSKAYHKPVLDTAIPKLAQWFAAVQQRASVIQVLEKAQASLAG